MPLHRMGFGGSLHWVTIPKSRIRRSLQHGDMGYEDLLEKANATTTNFNTLSVQIKDLESKMNANSVRLWRCLRAETGFAF